MSRFLQIGSCVLLLIQGCGRGDIEQVYSGSESLTDMLTFELTFGVEDLPEDYMLVEPYPEAIDITPEGDVLVVDENWVKVFDSNGKAKILFGGEGDGPGEFRSARDPKVSPDGYIAVQTRGAVTHFFRPDYSYIDRLDLRSQNPFSHIFQPADLRLERPEAVYCLGENERLFVLNTQDINPEKGEHREVFLIYQTADSLNVLARHEQTDSIIGGGRYMGILGWFQAAPLIRNRVVYIHPFHDSVFGPEESTYTITILDLETGERSEITHAFTPKEIDWEPRELSEETKQERPDLWERTQDMNERTQKTIDERVWSVPLLDLQTDDRFIFAFTVTENDSGEAMVDVFDADACRYLCSAYFPTTWGNVIRNGCYYRFNDYRLEEDYPRVEKYRIDPRVYGRR